MSIQDYTPSNTGKIEFDTQNNTQQLLNIINQIKAEIEDLKIRISALENNGG